MSQLELAAPALELAALLSKMQHAKTLHEQDRWDAMAWLEMFGSGRYQRCTCAKCLKLWNDDRLSRTGSSVGLAFQARSS